MELSYFAIIIGAIFVNNVVLAQFLGICPFLGVSSKVDTSLGMGAAVTFVMALSSIVAWSIQEFILVPLGIEYMQTIVFILVIAALVQMMIDALGLECDYIHGEDSVRKLSTTGNTGILVPAISKDTFFGTVEKEGVFPRKTFSMGEAFEKRFYLEAKIIE